MNSSTMLRSRPRLRWAVPAGALALVAAGTAAAGLIDSASAEPPLDPRTPAQLLVDIQQAEPKGMSGTVVQTSNLGLPDIRLPGPGGGGSSELSSTVTGTHTWRVWYAGPEKVRLALVGSTGESDIVRNGSDVWLWSSTTTSATHYTVEGSTRPAGIAGGVTGSPLPTPTGLPATPQAAADAALAALDPTTAVTVPGTTTVAGRRAYELVLEPRQSGTLVSQVRIAVDGAQGVPLRVQVFSTKGSAPGFEVGFTSVDFTVPQDRQFAFDPPPGTTVTEGTVPGHGAAEPPGAPATGSGHLPAQRPEVVGTGWTSVLVVTGPSGGLAGLGSTDDGGSGDSGGAAPGPGEFQGLLDSLPTVSGSWGSGRLLTGTLFSAVLADDGRVAVGAVEPQVLYDALAVR